MQGVYKLGAWFDGGAFPDQAIDDGGRSLADPNSSRNAQFRRRNYSAYAVADQMVWRPSDDSPQSVNLFIRLMGAPGDRNLISFSTNAGATLNAPFPGRDNDSAGLEFGVGRFSGSARNFDRSVGLFSRSAYPIRSTETFIELTYQIQLAPW